MYSDIKDVKLYADFLLKNFGKQDIIGEIFAFFKINCLEKGNCSPIDFDDKIRTFLNSEDDEENLCSIIYFLKKGKSDKENEMLKDFSKYIDDKYYEDCSIENIAKKLNVSYFYLCHAVKEKYNMSVTAFRTKKRLGEAMKRLIKTDDKISDIAYECGFDNSSYFAETFKKYIGISPSAFREEHKNVYIHDFYNYDDILLAVKLGCIRFTDNALQREKRSFETVTLYEPNETFKFLHETAVIKYHGVLYTSWYNCPQNELAGYTPICGKRSYDDGKTWSDAEIICDDKTEKILYCPPVYGICEDKLYMFVNQMVAPDHIHSLDLYVLNNETDKFERLWTRPIPFKLNTNVIKLPNGKLLLPGRVGELDAFPNTPAVLISDCRKPDAQWRTVKIAENGNLADGAYLQYPEISAICAKERIYIFCRNDMRKVPLVYFSDDYGETWGEAHSHDIPCISSKIYCGDLSDGRHYMLCNTDKFERNRMTIYFTANEEMKFTKRIDFFDTEQPTWGGLHYPAAFECDGTLYITATKGYDNGTRGAQFIKIKLDTV